jgi:hypothetical protein
MQTGATEFVCLDEGHRHAQFGTADCRGVAAASATENDEIKRVFRHEKSLLA